MKHERAHKGTQKGRPLVLWAVEVSAFYVMSHMFVLQGLAPYCN
jgi:hypothetical protein